MCKKRIQIDGLDCCLGEESADGMFGTYLTHPKQDRDIIQALFFFYRREQEDLLLFFFLCYYIVLLRLLILILKIHIMDTMKAYFCYRHMLL